MISDRRYYLLLGLIIWVMIMGLPVTLFENDSNQFAVMALRMVQENDWLNLFKGSEEYLDKPHLHYWLAALSFSVFGVSEVAYRLPALLALLLGAYSCYGLATLLYRHSAGKLASLIFLTSQTIVLSAIDVRTDAVLTGFSIFAIWKLLAFIETRKTPALLWGALGAGLAFSTKGQIALVVIGFTVMAHLAYTRKWRLLLDWRVLLALLVFTLSITPMLYAYYHQFDLHPEKLIRGKDQRSGLYFIFWEQSFERMSGEGVGQNSSDYFFFFHSFLWVVLPWTLLMLLALWVRSSQLVKLKFRKVRGLEFATLGALFLVFPLMSFAQFKLPHYLNVLMPLYAVLTAGYLDTLDRRKSGKLIKLLLPIHYGILALAFTAICLIVFFVFPLEQPFAYVLFFMALVCLVLYILRIDPPFPRLITLVISISLLINAVMNLHFYPSLLKYQGGSEMAKRIAEEQIPVDAIFKYSDNHSWALDFYTQRPVPLLPEGAEVQQENFWLYVTGKEKVNLLAKGWRWTEEIAVEQFRITRLQPRFLNPHSREDVLRSRHLLKLSFIPNLQE